ncbi:MAG: ATP-grasp domain-containing protein [Streptosporangiales bacterium]|nr:ATP-grasp domain-containing protein [Streptosporangiales bacterium]
MFDGVLVANRGEIAVRVVRTLRRLGVRSVAVYSDADVTARHAREADAAVRLGPTPAAESYLSIERVIAAAREAGVQAVHPGYGFLAENAAFARACAEAGLVFVGPPPAAIEAMGDKIRAKRTVAAAGVPVLPGYSEGPRGADGRGGEGAGSAGDLAAAAERVGYPVLIKPSAGGGGKGMRLVREAGELADAVAGARREARGAFGDDTLLLERYVERPRHIEIQVMADEHGRVIHLGERECSLQRRHQKIVEEAPSPLLDEATRRAMGAAAVEAARAVGYVGAGTVEFVVPADDPASYFFLEMNTRLQVEHPVTELVTGTDLVEWQLRAASREPLPLAQDDVRLDGHAVEARIYAEDPSRGFLPTGGRVLALAEPDLPNVRVDSGLAEGEEVTSAYDPMLAKLVAWGPDRGSALRRLDQALARTAVLGVVTNVAFLRALLVHPEVAAGRLDTGLVERALAELVGGEVPAEVYAAAALDRHLDLEPAGPVADRFAVPDGWRVTGPAWTLWRIQAAGEDPVGVRVRGRAHAAEVSVADGDPVPAAARRTPDGLAVRYGGAARTYVCVRDGSVAWLAADGHTWALREEEPLAAAGHLRSGGDAGDTVRSPMPGTVLAVHVNPGDRVAAGTPVAVVEAMKMEHSVAATIDGKIGEVYVKPGQPVAMDEPLVVIEQVANA